MALIHLIYVSTAREEFDIPELERIIESSARHNLVNHVTGMLLYSRGTFLQVLEGEAEHVDATYARLGADPRHHGLILIVREPIAERSFPQWAMGFRVVDPERNVQHPAFHALGLKGFDALSLGAKPGLALEILLDFSRH